jgi:hypothetical protein
MSKPPYHWIVFKQNNTHGYFVHSDALSNYVALRVDCNITPTNYYKNDEFSEYCESILFYPLDLYDIDCDCCGSRWNILKQTFESIDSVRDYLEDKLYSNAVIFHNIPKNIITCWQDEHYNEDILTLYEIEELFVETLYHHARDESTVGSYCNYKNVVEKRRKTMTTNEIYHMYEKLNLQNETNEDILFHHKQLIDMKILLKIKYYMAITTELNELIEPINYIPNEFAHLVNYYDIPAYPEINSFEFVSELQNINLYLLKTIIKFI